MKGLLPLILSICLSIANPLVTAAAEAAYAEVCLFLEFAYRSLEIGLHSKLTIPRGLKHRAELPPRDLRESAVSKVIHLWSEN